MSLAARTWKRWDSSRASSICAKPASMARERWPPGPCRARRGYRSHTPGTTAARASRTARPAPIRRPARGARCMIGRRSGIRCSQGLETRALVHDRSSLPGSAARLASEPWPLNGTCYLSAEAGDGFRAGGGRRLHGERRGLDDEGAPDCRRDSARPTLPGKAVGDVDDDRRQAHEGDDHPQRVRP